MVLTLIPESKFATQGKTFVPTPPKRSPLALNEELLVSVSVVMKVQLPGT